MKQKFFMGNPAVAERNFFSLPEGHDVWTSGTGLFDGRLVQIKQNGDGTCLREDPYSFYPGAGFWVEITPDEYMRIQNAYAESVRSETNGIT